ncbi:pre-mRNA-splicing factor CWC22 homolog [Coffea eugenioides]|uniref:pre-mRNA-splicing factor CWC22 homolog n=1 Tax=Coffea eugenioides TaxID=49369 RepID=UPI000F6102C9|nr:pre-mRNA-splicing factor CWC22 homolog [Coffea eugenioides]
MDNFIVSNVDRSREGWTEEEMAFDPRILASQRPLWDALKKTINRLVNKVTVSNVRNVAKELLSENLIWGRGLFCSAILKTSIASHSFTPVFAALVAAINSRYPDVGYLLIKRIVEQFKIGCKQNDKHQLVPLVKLLAHLVNQGVVHELLAVEFLFVLLQDATEDNIEVAAILVRQCGSTILESNPRGLAAVFERFREILQDGDMDKRAESLIESLFAIRSSRFSSYPAMRPELDIAESADQVIHEISLCNDLDPEMYLDVFHLDPQVLMSDEERYKMLKAIVLGEEDYEKHADDGAAKSNQGISEEDSSIEDKTETDVENLKKTIFLTMMSGNDFEDAGHKLLAIPLRRNQEMVICKMLLDCCSHQKTYNRYFTLLAQQLCLLKEVYRDNFENCFLLQYSIVDSLKTHKLHNVAKFFAHLLSSDSLTWHILGCIRLTEENTAATTSSSGMFIKILFQELAKELGVPLLKKRLNDPTLQGSLDSIFPKNNNTRNLRFSINFFTSIGIGGLTDNLRENLRNMQKQNHQVSSHSDQGTQSFGTGGSKPFQ